MLFTFLILLLVNMEKLTFPMPYLGVTLYLYWTMLL